MSIEHDDPIHLTYSKRRIWNCKQFILKFSIDKYNMVPFGLHAHIGNGCSGIWSCAESLAPKVIHSSEGDIIQCEVFQKRA